MPSYTARNSVAPMANSARTGGTTRRCCHGHSYVVGATCSNPKPGMPDRATRLSLHLERIGQNAHHFPFVSGTLGPGLTELTRRAKLMLKQSIFVIPTGLLHSHLPLALNHHKHLSCFMQLCNRSCTSADFLSLKYYLCTINLVRAPRNKQGATTY